MRVLPRESACWTDEGILRPSHSLALLDVEFLFPVVSEDAVLADHESVQDDHDEDRGDPGDAHDNADRDFRTEAVIRRGPRRLCREQAYGSVLFSWLASTYCMMGVAYVPVSAILLAPSKGNNCDTQT